MSHDDDVDAVDGDLLLLSKLAAGELDTDARDALLARISSEPGLLAAWDELNALGPRMEALLDVPPPPAVDDRLVAKVTGRPTDIRWGVAPIVLAAVACIVLGVGLGRLVRDAPGEIVLVSGAVRVDGRSDLHVGEVRVAVDGEATVTVEPIAGALRVTQRGGRMSDRTEGGTRRAAWLAAAAGAAVTVAVYEGQAVVFAGDAPPVTVHAGGTTTVGRPSPSPTPRPSPAADTDLAGENARLTQENQLLEAMLADLEAEYRGTPVPWPDDVPAQYRAPAFERTVRDAVGACAPDVDVVGFECTEPPCLALLRPSRDDWWDRLVNRCPQWVDAYSNSVSSASGDATCPDGSTERYQVLGYSYGRIVPYDTLPAEEKENVGKRFTARIDEIERSWPCGER